MNKTYILTLIGVLLTSLLFAQDYYVLHLSGKVKETDSQRNLMVGDVIKAETELEFLSESAKVIVISKESGRMLIDGSKGKKSYKGEFIDLVKNVLFPVASNESMSTRKSIETKNEDVTDLQSYFGEEQRAIIGDEYIIHGDPTVFKKKGGSSYIYKYYIGKDAINKVMRIADGEIRLDKKALYPIESYDIPENGSKVEFYFTNVISKKSIKLAEFKLCYVNTKSLKKEVATLLTALQIQGNDQEISNQVNAYISQQYGVPFEGEVDKWLTSVGFISQSN
ncbi:hypothetical protein [Flammeovirga pacifica]|uniref:Uncharacterized protein n=1 Tax=Flammeovirga pacifica TaxID=915059 RepID=A0A1S1YYS3_FLAPC|nr:hypothetical protein [Flammeovirga pacifica]OHX66161.1 hypothetical protein NH26_07255 [Flammeovirga pacifica]